MNVNCYSCLEDQLFSVRWPRSYSNAKNRWCSKKMKWTDLKRCTSWTTWKCYRDKWQWWHWKDAHHFDGCICGWKFRWYKLKFWWRWYNTHCFARSRGTSIYRRWRGSWGTSTYRRWNSFYLIFRCTNIYLHILFSNLFLNKVLILLYLFKKIWK